MSKIDKQRTKLKERIARLENDMQASLSKKKSDTVAFDVPKCLQEISKLKAELASLK